MADLAQLTKANSIEGNKKDNVTVIYTPWSNLKKDGAMAVGQVGFEDPRKVRRVLVPQRENAIINRLNKTRVEVAQPELRQEREEHLRQLRKKDQAAVQARVSYLTPLPLPISAFSFYNLFFSFFVSFPFCCSLSFVFSSFV